MITFKAKRYPSVKLITDRLKIPVSSARTIRSIMEGPKLVFGETRLQRINPILRGTGVEKIPAGQRENSPAIWYVNMGDSYAQTVLKYNDCFHIGCWGAIVERGNYKSI